jgi:predicted nucleic acid-binding protein
VDQFAESERHADCRAFQKGESRENQVVLALGSPIGPNDLLIGSIAMAHRAILITHNTREFGRIAGLKTEDW